MKRLWLTLILMPLFASAQEGEEKVVPFGAHPGYLFEVTEEKDKRDIEMVLLEKPKPKPILQDVIFNEKLTKEFRLQYEYKFGSSSAEQTINSISRDDSFEANGQNVTVKEYRRKQQSFGEYIGARLTEYHFDNWIKSDPAMRPVYVAKEKLSHLEVKTKKGYKFKMAYSLSGNTMDLNIDNPYQVEARIRLQMNSSQFGPGAPEETIYYMGYQATKLIKVESIYKEYDGVIQLIGSRPITDSLSASLTGSVDRRVQGESIQQDLILIGLAWHD